jgi:hypothetical protein
MVDLQPLGQRCGRGLATAPAVPSEQLHPGDDWLDLGKIALVIARQQRQVGLAQRHLAMPAASRAGGDGLVQNLGQEATTALASNTALRGQLRGALSPRFAVLPCDGGRLELSGVLGGWPSFAFNSTTQERSSVASEARTST